MQSWSSPSLSSAPGVSGDFSRRRGQKIKRRMARSRWAKRWGCWLSCLTDILQDDEDFLVDNDEEMDIKEELEIKQDSRKEYLGKFQYKVHVLLTSKSVTWYCSTQKYSWYHSCLHVWREILNLIFILYYEKSLAILPDSLFVSAWIWFQCSVPERDSHPMHWVASSGSGRDLWSLRQGELEKVF